MSTATNGDGVAAHGDAAPENTVGEKRTRDGDAAQASEPEKKQKFADIEECVASEDTCGITHYLHDTKGFFGLLKDRWSDFLVNEVDLHGNVVHWTTRTIAPEMQQKKDAEADPTADITALLADVVGRERAEGMVALQAAGEAISKLGRFERAEASVPEPVMVDGVADKGARTRVHQLVRTYLPQLDSTTVQGVIKVFVRRGKKKREPQRWAGGANKYLEFVLVKQNRDTMDALSSLASFCHTKPKAFTTAGTKDKRAVTTQRVRAFKVMPETLEAFNGKMRGMMTGNYRFASEGFRNGDLKGNRFTIVLRNVAENDAQIHDALSKVRDGGFINYFGLQRFGTGAVPTHRFGLALLKSEYAKLIHYILAPRPNEQERCRRARLAYLERGNVEEAIRLMPGFMNVEKRVLSGIRRHGADHPANALDAVGRNMKTMYLHAFQSLVWNEMASLRLRTHGRVVVEGDLVMQDGDELGWDAAAPKSGTLEETEQKRRRVRRARVVTKEDIEAGTVSMEQVVLPLPGFDIVLPQNDIGDAYTARLESDGLTLESFRHKSRDLRQPGSYRNVLNMPVDMEWTILRYNDRNADLCHTELDVAQELPECVTGNLCDDGAIKAVRMSFTLPSSSYATMLLREATHNPTSSKYHRQLSNAGKTDE